MTDFRICFSKTGPLVYISHLDLTHTFIRAANRARLPLRYSSGFNPHPKLTFALPLSVGMAGENELCDMGLAADIPIEEFSARLRAELPPFLMIKSVKEPIGKLRNVTAADYTVVIRGIFGIGGKIEEILSRPEISVLKKTKSGEKVVNIKPQIFAFSSEEFTENAEDEKDSIKAADGSEKEECGGTKLFLKVDASPDGGYLNPDYVLKALAEQGLFELRDCAVIRTSITLSENGL